MNITDLSGLRAIRDTHEDQRIIFVSGQFNVVHPGHIRLLKFAQSLGDRLAVGLLPDGAGPYIPQELRLSAMLSLDMVSDVFILPDSVMACIEALRPDVVVKGAEHETRFNSEEELLRSWGGELIFCSNDPHFSFDDIVKGIIGSRPRIETMPLPQEYFERHGITRESLAGVLEAIPHLRICVIGDLIIDEYVTCTPLGMSREDPTIVVSPISETHFVGGAGVVAGHAAGFGSKVSFLTVAGCDDAADFARHWFVEHGIAAHVIRDPDRPTTVKRRYRAQNKTLLRVNRLSQQHISHERQKDIESILADALPALDLVVLSDFSYGVLPPSLVDRCMTMCKQRGVPVTADSQTSSQIGDLGKFTGALLVTPTEIEARQAVGEYTVGLAALSHKLITGIKADNIIITLGENGCLVFTDPKTCDIFTDNLPAFNRLPIDAAGAGDSLLTTASLAMAAGADIWQAALLGSIAAGLQVSRIGNIPLTMDELQKSLGFA